MITLFAVMKVKKDNTLDVISLYDDEGHYRGAAKFETRKEAEVYMDKFKKRMKGKREFNLEIVEEKS